MSHLPALSDYVGNKKPLVRIETTPAGEQAQPKVERLDISDEQEIKNLFTGMSRSLSYSAARVARNKKVRHCFFVSFLCG